ncbi:MAG TPA: Mov34/MPN/PAD-1 family protein [Thermoanaerobaculia bacterium]|nr:Mov34/MPN/PAD-1 family protein [Thermoanaerobaculia bacterium]
MHALLLLAALACGDLCSPQAAVWYDHLLAEGGYGRLPHERAAFLIRESDGTLTLQPWPDTGFRHATFRGVVPPRTIAVLHTHPRGESQPSVRDRGEARRLGVPVVVITPEGVVAALPGGAVMAVGEQ